MDELSLREALSILGKRGAASTNARCTPEQKTEWSRKGGLKGGKARARIYPKEWQSDNGRKAANARWGRRKASERVKNKTKVLGVWR